MKIAGEFTSEQWLAFKANLEGSKDEHRWDLAYQCFYRTRIDTRYLGPISAIREADTESGEGFAIVALFCTLIEFLESCEQGYNFRLLKKGEKPGQYEYGPLQAKNYFKDFLKERKPFSSKFPSKLIDSFYQNVRCGLLHEAQTKGGWAISAKPNMNLVNSENGKITLFRNRLVPDLEEYFKDYRERLRREPATQQAFIRKLDHLCKN